MLELSLYVHVPYCRSKCAYCDFSSFPRPARPEGEAGAVVRKILSDGVAALTSLAAEWGGLSLVSIFVGGGTPTVLDPSSLESLLGGLASLSRAWPGLREWTVECNPESLDADKLGLFSSSGVDRLSLGVQSLEEEALRRAGRPCGLPEVRTALGLLSSRWGGRWSADLMVGLPGQSPEGPRRDASEILDAGAGHLSLYSLILEEGTPLSRAAAADPSLLPGEDEKADAWDGAAELLRSRGLERYEISNFALPGQKCLHNLRYWRMDSWLGLGPSAVSSLPLGGGKLLRLREADDISLWLSAEPPERETLEPATALEEWLIMGLRTAEGIEPEAASARFGIEAASALEPLFSEWVGRGLARRAGGRLALSDRGMDLSDALLLDCLVRLGRPG